MILFNFICSNTDVIVNRFGLDEKPLTQKIVFFE